MVATAYIFPRNICPRKACCVDLQYCRSLDRKNNRGTTISSRENHQKKKQRTTYICVGWKLGNQLNRMMRAGLFVLIQQLQLQILLPAAASSTTCGTRRQQPSSGILQNSCTFSCSSSHPPARRILSHPTISPCSSVTRIRRLRCWYIGAGLLLLRLRLIAI